MNNTKSRQKFNIADALARANESKSSKVIGSVPEISFSNQIKSIYYKEIHFGKWKKYQIDMNEVLDLVDSLLSIGLEQNLVVKESENGYVVVTGHKRLTAINYIFENHLSANLDILSSLEYPACVIIPKDEEDLITRLRMHDTNVHARSTISFDMIEDYYYTISEIQKQNLKINGKSIKGKTRKILSQQFDFSDGTAKKYIKVLKDGDEPLKERIKNGEISVNAAYDKLVKADKHKTKKGGNLAKTKKIENADKLSETKNNEDVLKSFKQDLTKNYRDLTDIIKQVIENEALLNSKITINGKTQTVKQLIKESSLAKLCSDYYAVLLQIAPKYRKID